MGLVCEWILRLHKKYRTSTNEQVLANLLGLAGVCPFVGSISDLIGRRPVAIIGASLIVIGMIVCSTVNSMNYFIGAYTWLIIDCRD